MRFARDGFERRGSAQRTNRNMVVFLAPDTKRLDELSDAVRHYLAWDWCADRIEELNLSPHQVKQVHANRQRSDEAATARIAQTYHWVLVPEQPEPARPPLIAVEKAEGSNDRLAERVTERLTRAGLLASSVNARTIWLDLDQKLSKVWSGGHISAGELWSYSAQHPYLTRRTLRTHHRRHATGGAGGGLRTGRRRPCRSDQPGATDHRRRRAQCADDPDRHRDAAGPTKAVGGREDPEHPVLRCLQGRSRTLQPRPHPAQPGDPPAARGARRRRPRGDRRGARPPGGGVHRRQGPRRVGERAHAAVRAVKPTWLQQSARQRQHGAE